MKIQAKKVHWIGVYKKVTFFGQPSRILKVVLPDLDEAAEWVKTTCAESRCLANSSDFMFEPVDVKMHAWDPSKT